MRDPSFGAVSIGCHSCGGFPASAGAAASVGKQVCVSAMSAPQREHSMVPSAVSVSCGGAARAGEAAQSGQGSFHEPPDVAVDMLFITNRSPLHVWHGVGGSAAGTPVDRSVRFRSPTSAVSRVISCCWRATSAKSAAQSLIA